MKISPAALLAFVVILDLAGSSPLRADAKIPDLKDLIDIDAACGLNLALVKQRSRYFLKDPHPAGEDVSLKILHCPRIRAAIAQARTRLDRAQEKYRMVRGTATGPEDPALVRAQGRAAALARTLETLEELYQINEQAIILAFEAAGIKLSLQQLERIPSPAPSSP